MNTTEPLADFLSHTFLESPVLMMLAIFIPLVVAAANVMFSKTPLVRNIFGISSALALFALVTTLVSRKLGGEVIEADYLEIMPGISLAFKVESLGLIYALVASLLWSVTLLFASGYMTARKKIHLTRFFTFFAIAISCSMGIAFAKNLFTMFVFYELLTFSTYPLVNHDETEKSKKSARVYLGILVGTSLAFLLPAIIWTYQLTGSLDFTNGGIFAESETPTYIKAIIMLLFAFGTAKAGMMPFHKWLPSAMVAPTPVSALLHAVAVVKAGVFIISKVVIYIIGAGSFGGTEFFSPDIVLYVAAATIIISSIIALRQDNLKLRLAYSTISQLSYIVIAVALANLLAFKAAGLHIVAHAVAKITLFFSAGAIAVATDKKAVSEINGVGRKLPILGLCFFIASLSIIGIPFLAGGESKEMIKAAADQAGAEWVIYVLYISMALNAAYYLPISYRAFFKKYEGKEVVKLPTRVTLAIVITTTLTMSFVLYKGYLLEIMRVF